MSLVLRAGVRPVSRSFMFSLPLRMYKEWRDREKAAKMIRRLQDPIKAQDQDRKKSDKKYHSDPHYRQQRIEASRRPHVIAQRVQGRSIGVLRVVRIHHDSSSGSDLLGCHACFGGDWSRAMPIGYEDFVFAQGKVLHLRDTPGATTPSPHSKGEEGHDGNHGLAMVLQILQPETMHRKQSIRDPTVDIARGGIRLFINAEALSSTSWVQRFVVKNGWIELMSHVWLGILHVDERGVASAQLACGCLQTQKLTEACITNACRSRAILSREGAQRAGINRAILSGGGSRRYSGYRSLYTTWPLCSALLRRLTAQPLPFRCRTMGANRLRFLPSPRECNSSGWAPAMYRSEGSVYDMEPAMELYSPMRRIWAIAQSRPTCRSACWEGAPDQGIEHLLWILDCCIALIACRPSLEIRGSLNHSPALSHHPSEDENLHQKAPKSSDQSRFCC
ncbi:hypothetical protein KCU61_g153, partial [Aureobasidium melanogenum]